MQHDTFSSKLAYGCKYINDNDLNIIEHKVALSKNYLGKVWIVIKFFFQGKGILSMNNLKKCFDNKYNHEYLRHYPKIQQWIKIQYVAQDHFRRENSSFSNRQDQNDQRKPLTRRHSAPNSQTIASESTQIPSNIYGIHRDPKKYVFPSQQNTPTQQSVSKVEEKDNLPIDDSCIMDEWYQLEYVTTTLNIECHEYKRHTSDTSYFSHRYVDILCPLKNSVLVDSKRIHANYVGENCKSTIKFTATQAPVEVDHDKFWSLVNQENDLIVDLTKGAENYLPFAEKSYAPSENYPLLCTSPKLKITLKKTQEIPLKETSGTNHCIIYTYEIKDFDKDTTKEVQRVFYPVWPDGGVVSVDEFKELIEILKSLKWSKPIIHCQAGVGRTGTLITTLIILEEYIKKGLLNKDNYKKDFLRILREVIIDCRKERSHSFVQRPSQFKLIHDYIYFVLFLENELAP